MNYHRWYNSCNCICWKYRVSKTDALLHHL